MARMVPSLLRTLISAVLAAAMFCMAASAQILSEAELRAKIEPPNELGELLSEDGVWSLVDRKGALSGYVFETGALAPLPGFSGAPIHVLVTIDADGRFLHAELLEHNEPVFVSGLGNAPFHAFMRQYRGLSVFDSITVGVPYGAGDRASSAHVYLDGVTKATASVRIAHESILAASLEVARWSLKGLTGGPAPTPRQDTGGLDWEALVAEGLVQRRLIRNAEVEAAFADTLWEDDDPEAADDPDGVYLDLWVIDIGPRALAEAVLDAETLAARDQFLSVATHDEPILLLANGRHGLVSEAFIRNTSPDLLFARQDGLPIALRDADIEAGLGPGVPEFEHRMILRTDRRLGFDPTRPWDLQIRAAREHGVFMPEIGLHDFSVTHATPERFFSRPEAVTARPVWVESILARLADLAVLAVVLFGLAAVMWRRMAALSMLGQFQLLRLGFLAGMTVFVGWWGQGQLSIVTAIGTLRAAVEGGRFAFLLYDPFSLLLWGVVLGSLLVWGRGFFCGWLCPYGALQEGTHALGRTLRIPQINVPDRWDRRLKWVKYGVLAVLLVTALTAPALNDFLVEVEPFKTAITVGFDREWYYVAYAALWLVLGMALFKGFCRYVCPLGALLAVGGLLRRWEWIPRRVECGSPCQLCKVRCNYGAIERDGRIRYDECFQCLDCVTIHEDPRQCVPLVLAAKRRQAA